MTREDIETCFSYHEAGAAMEYYAQEQERLGEIEGDDVVNAFEAGAEWAQEFMIKRTCEWLSSNKDNYIIDIEGETIVDAAIIEDFRKAMDE
jgi:adenylosuccinate synthase